MKTMRLETINSQPDTNESLGTPGISHCHTAIIEDGSLPDAPGQNNHPGAAAGAVMLYRKQEVI